MSGPEYEKREVGGNLIAPRPKKLITPKELRESMAAGKGVSLTSAKPSTRDYLIRLIAGVRKEIKHSSKQHLGTPAKWVDAALLCDVVEHEILGVEEEIEPATEFDWPEDWKLENGKYTNKCCKCSTFFVGYKRRALCKKCAEVQQENAQ